MTLYDELVWRGLIKDVSDPKVKDLLNEYMEFNKDKWTPKYYNTNTFWA